MHLFTQSPLGADGEAIAHDEHPDHQLRIDRGTANVAVGTAAAPAAPRLDQGTDQPGEGGDLGEHAHPDKSRKIAAPVPPAFPSSIRPLANHKENGITATAGEQARLNQQNLPLEDTTPES